MVWPIETKWSSFGMWLTDFLLLVMLSVCSAQSERSEVLAVTGGEAGGLVISLSIIRGKNVSSFQAIVHKSVHPVKQLRSTTTRSLIYQPQSLDNGSLRTSHRWRPSVGNSISVLKSTATPICFDSQTMPARPRQKHCLLCSVLLRGCYASANRLTEVSGLVNL